jgi:hypothetical protein
MKAGKVNILLVVSEPDVEKIAEAQLVNVLVNIKECDIGGGDDALKLDRIVIVEALKTKEKGIMALDLQRKDTVNWREGGGGRVFGKELLGGRKDLGMWVGV